MKYVGRFFTALLTLVLILVILILGVVLTLEYGPSKSARNLFVNSAMESSAGKFLATTFLGKKNVEEIMKLNSIEETDEVTDSSLIVIAPPAGSTEEASGEDTFVDPRITAQAELDRLAKRGMDLTDLAEEEGIEIFQYHGPTFNAKVALIHDPSRVCVANCGHLGSGRGMTVAAMAEANGALIAINGGGFEDEGGHGSGSIPIGIVIQDGELKWGELETTYEVIGFDSNNILVVGKMTAQKALDRGMQTALSFGPILIVNGEPTIVNGYGSGVNPRTAIGQASDGTVILIVADGRQPNSLGATYSDLINMMLEYGAVNAANLDGGSSSMMWYKGEYINQCASLYGARSIPTTILVK